MTTLSMKERTRFGTWNVRTLLEKSGLEQLSKEFIKLNLFFSFFLTKNLKEAVDNTLLGSLVRLFVFLLWFSCSDFISPTFFVFVLKPHLNLKSFLGNNFSY